jgi:hypothetical protein
MRRKLAVPLALVAAIGPAWAGADGGGAQEQRETSARAVLWTDPGDISVRDVFWGPASAARAPQPPFTFIKEDTGGSKPKVVVRDAAGTIWNVKFSGGSTAKNEVHAEIAASRIAWTFGYEVEEHYYVAEGVIQGVKDLRRAAKSIDEAGRFAVARFERQDPAIRRTGRNWSLNSNPFEDTKELSGLMLVLALVNNWDTKSSNLSIFERAAPDGVAEHIHVVSDFGSSFGRMGPPALFPTRNRWSLEDYRQEPFVDKLKNESVYVNHKGDVVIPEVPVEHARWFAGLASQLSAEQARRAFEAAGASPDEVRGFSARLLEKLDELQRAIAGDRSTR